ncbi:MAG: 3'(2'),5'-bisphosphate nucleotidase CysQ [Hyphomicrobiaceae bacterium]
MTRHDHRALTDALLPVVLAAGKLEMGYFDAGCAVQTKADQSPVTIADQQAEAMIITALAEIMPDHAIVAEEAFAAGQRWASSETFLLVDALDGTKQFVSGHREFTINIALVHQGRPVYGLVYAPALGELFVTDGPDVAVRALIEPGAALTSLASANPSAIRVAPHFGAVVALQSRSRNIDQSNVYLEAFPVTERRLMGSSYKFCLVAAGIADIYPQLGDTREWDTAAGEAVLVAAGGHVVSVDGTPIRYGKTGGDYLNPKFIASSAPLANLKTAVC